jgi:phosphoglycerate dehydrogenase-like enzyme
MHVVGVDLKPPTEGSVDVFCPMDRFHDVLPDADYLILSLPLTDQTRGMIGDAEFSVMKPHACLINLSRGSIVDEPAMIRALKEKKLGGAGCDVFDVEPLPGDSELYRMDTVIVSPHMAGLTPHMTIRAVDLFCENLKRFVQGRALLYPVNIETGF